MSIRILQDENITYQNPWPIYLVLNQILVSKQEFMTQTCARTQIKDIKRLAFERCDMECAIEE